MILVHPATQMVWWIDACVTSGFCALGVNSGMGYRSAGPAFPPMKGAIGWAGARFGAT
jgi:hypothetical protein